MVGPERGRHREGVADRAPVDLAAPGQWEVRVAATRGEARAHEAQRFVVR
jgi:nitrogen fixation protein FixH